MSAKYKQRAMAELEGATRQLEMALKRLDAGRDREWTKRHVETAIRRVGFAKDALEQLS